MYLHKNGIELRKISGDDLPRLLAMKRENWWGTHGTFIGNIEDQKKWYESLGHHDLVLIAEESGKDHGVGIFSDIDWYSRSLNASFSIFKDSRDTRVNTVLPECGLDFIFEILNMNRVGAEVLETHVAAQKIEINHLGFKVEGRRRQAVFKSGKYYDSIQIGLLREEWEQSQRVQKLREHTGTCNQQFDHAMASKLISRYSSSFGFSESNHALQITPQPLVHTRIAEAKEIELDQSPY